MQIRQQHKQEVIAFLQKEVANQPWRLSLPRGYGHETYFARSREHACFVKIGAQGCRYQAMASLGLTPEVLAAGSLPAGQSILVQPLIPGEFPQRKQYRLHLDQFARTIHSMHHGPAVQQTLPPVPYQNYHEAGLACLEHIRHKWQRHQHLVPALAGYVQACLEQLHNEIDSFEGSGLVASHNDICNVNWLITPAGRLYLIDLESMSLDDPALDIGATLWWYYPLALRERFLHITGHAGDPAFARRMRVRMALHCLNIILPREGSFDRFDPAGFDEALTDFRAIFAGHENPQGYDE